MDRVLVTRYHLDESPHGSVFLSVDSSEENHWLDIFICS